MKLFTCIAYNARMPVTACGPRLALLRTASANSGDRMRLQKCEGCEIGACHKRGEDAPGVEYELREMTVAGPAAQVSRAKWVAAQQARMRQPSPKLQVVREQPAMQAHAPLRVSVTEARPQAEPVRVFFGADDQVVVQLPAQAAPDHAATMEIGCSNQEASMAKAKGERPTSIECECGTKVKVGEKGVVPKTCKLCAQRARRARIAGKDAKPRIPRAASPAEPPPHSGDDAQASRAAQRRHAPVVRHVAARAARVRGLPGHRAAHAEGRDAAGG